MLPSGIWNLESWVLGSRIQPKESGIQLKIGIQNPLTENLESTTENSESTAWNPGSNTILDFLSWVISQYVITIVTVVSCF